MFEGEFGSAVSSNVQCTLGMFLSQGRDMGYNQTSAGGDTALSKYISSHEIWHCKRIKIH